MVGDKHANLVHLPQRGQVLKLNLDPTLGHEQKGYRPVLVISASLFNKHTGFCWVVPVTTSQKGLPNEVRLLEGLSVHGTLLLSQLRSIDWRARPFSVACSVSRDFLEDITARILSALAPE